MTPSSRLLKAVGDLLFPLSCSGCQLEGEAICPDCRAKIMRQPLVWDNQLKPIQELAGLSDYQYPIVRQSIYELKYHSIREYADVLGYLICSKVPEKYFKDSYLVPIPLHRSRLIERGFNQSELLALSIGQRLGLETVGALRRIRNTTSQVNQLNHVARQANIEDCFEITPQATAISNHIVILVDDVITTGATLREAARVLKLARPREIKAVVVARD
jgi:ComF family protein